MNTSKEAAKKANAAKSENLEPLTKEEENQMQQPLPTQPKTENPGVVDFQKLNDNEFLDSVFDNMEETDTKEAIEVTGNYIDFSEFTNGEERNYIFIRRDTFTTKDGEVKPAVVLMDRERKNWLCASTVVVNSLLKVEQLPAKVRIKISGKTKGTKGDYYNANVYIL